MTDKLTKCAACSGRGYFRCDCWPGDCICGEGDTTCWECEGDGYIDQSYEEFEESLEPRDPTPAPRAGLTLANPPPMMQPNARLRVIHRLTQRRPPWQTTT